MGSSIAWFSHYGSQHKCVERPVRPVFPDYPFLMTMVTLIKISFACTLNVPLSNLLLKLPSREYFLAYKKIKNKCNTLTRKTKKIYFGYMAKNKNFATNKTFWNTVRLFLQTKVQYQSDEKQRSRLLKKIKISKLKTKIKTNWSLLKQMTVLKTKVSLLKCSTNILYIAIVEKTSGISPESLGDSSLSENDEETKKNLKRENHPSVSKIKLIKMKI